MMAKKGLDGRGIVVRIQMLPSLQNPTEYLAVTWLSRAAAHEKVRYRYCVLSQSSRASCEPHALRPLSFCVAACFSIVSEVREVSQVRPRHHSLLTSSSWPQCSPAVKFLEQIKSLPLPYAIGVTPPKLIDPMHVYNELLIGQPYVKESLVAWLAATREGCKLASPKAFLFAGNRGTGKALSSADGAILPFHSVDALRDDGCRSQEWNTPILSC